MRWQAASSTSAGLYKPAANPAAAQLVEPQEAILGAAVGLDVSRFSSRGAVSLTAAASIRRRRLIANSAGSLPAAQLANHGERRS